MITPPKEFIEVFKATNGALSVTESIAIMNLAAQAPKGLAIEYGTYRGKSAFSAAVGLGAIEFTLVDPIFEDTDIVDEINKNYLSLNLKPDVWYSPNKSIVQLDETNEMYAWVFLDSGDHDSDVMDEIRLLENRILPNGILVFHDIFSQFIKVTDAYTYLLGTGKYEEILINWDEIVEYVNANDLEANNLSWHHQELKNPCFVGALKRK